MKIYTEDNEAIPAIQVLPDVDPAPTGYTEVTDIVDAKKYGLSAIDPEIVGWSDRLCLRSKLKVLVYTKMGVAAPADVDDQTKWDLLTAGEKEVAAKYFIISKESFFLEVENDLRLWTVRAGDFRHWTMEDRKLRAEMAESILFMRLQNVDDAKQCMADLHQIAPDTVIDIDGATNKLNGKARVKDLSQQYVEGLEDAASDGIAAVKDWINSEPGTPYENDGFMQLTYPFKGTHTSASVRDELLAALDGNY